MLQIYQSSPQRAINLKLSKNTWNNNAPNTFWNSYLGFWIPATDFVWKNCISINVAYDIRGLFSRRVCSGVNIQQEVCRAYCSNAWGGKFNDWTKLELHVIGNHVFLNTEHTRMCGMDENILRLMGDL